MVASALGVPALLPFLKAVCNSKKSWQARHTGIKIVQQIAILMGCSVLPHLRALVEIIEAGLNDEQQKVRTITALSLAALAEAATPYGIEAFDSVLKPLWKGIRQHRGKGLAAFLKAIGFIIPLMDAEYANYYTREVMIILLREFASPDEEMKKIVLKVVKQCVATEGVQPAYVRAEILPEFFKNFWVRRMALDRRNYRALVETTEELAKKVGASEIVTRIVEDLKDESEPYRKMVMETVEKVISSLSAADIDQRLEEQLVDGILYAFQEQTNEDTAVMLNGFGTIVSALGSRTKPYLPQICGTIKWRLNNKSAKVRQQAADLISRVAVVMRACNEEQLMGHLGVVLYEYLGEEYPEVLGSILGALKAIVNVIGMTKMTPPIKDLLPRLTPILKNRHEVVQENCIDLVGRIADRGAEYVSAREWMRICFELLDMLRAHKKAIRRATVNTFGYIAKAIGPQDVLATLLNNLKVQERQNRVCTTVAIAIVAETCSPFTVPAGVLDGCPRGGPAGTLWAPARRCCPGCSTSTASQSSTCRTACSSPSPSSSSTLARWVATTCTPSCRSSRRGRRPLRDASPLRAASRATSDPPLSHAARAPPRQTARRHRGLAPLSRRPPAASDSPGRAHRPGPGPPADGVHHGEAHGARLGRARARGRDAALPQPALAKHLRDVAPRHQRRHGGHRGHALLPRPDGRAPLHVAGALPPGAKGSRGLLEDLQQPLHRVAAGNGGCVPAHRRRRPQPVRPYRAGPVPLRAAATGPLLSASLGVRPLFSPSLASVCCRVPLPGRDVEKVVFRAFQVFSSVLLQSPFFISPAARPLTYSRGG